MYILYPQRDATNVFLFLYAAAAVYDYVIISPIQVLSWETNQSSVVNQNHPCQTVVDSLTGDDGDDDSDGDVG